MVARRGAPARTSVDVQIVGDARGVAAMLDALDTATSPVALTAFLGGVVSPYVRQRARSRFATEGDDVSGQWAPLLASTVDRRAQGDWPVGPEHPINQRSGELIDYITESPDMLLSSPLGATLVYPSKPPTGDLATKVQTAQQGKAFPRTRPRPVIGLNERDLLFVLGGIMGMVQKAGRAAGMR